MEWKRELERFEPVHRAELPGAVGELAGHLNGLSAMFPHDWVPMMALTFWSALVPSTARIENLGLNLWFMGLNPQGSGKNITSDELYKVTRATLGLAERDIALFTGGSAEGMARQLKGEGRSLLAYHREYAGFLRSLRQMQGAKEVLCNLYDGADVSHQLSQGGVEARDPHVVVVATTTMDAIAEAGNREDLTNGYLSRFFFCAPDSLDVAPEHFPTEQERMRLAVRLADRLLELGEVGQVDCDRYAERVLEQYRDSVGLYSGRVRDLDRERGNEETPPGRLVARVKKVASLLALADNRSTIEAGEMALAVRFVGRGNAYQKRIAGWIGASKSDVVANRVLAQLEKESPLTSRILQQRTHARATEVADALDVLIGGGRVYEMVEGKTRLYGLKKG